MCEGSLSSSSRHQIFFKDGKSEIKGPFTEAQVQEWYRQGHFENEFQFFFLNKSEAPIDSTVFYTLQALCAHNGASCPFKKIERGSEAEMKAELEKRLEQIGKSFAELKANVHSAAALELRLRDCQQRVEKLQPDSVDKENAVPAAAAAPQTSTQEEKKKEKEEGPEKEKDYLDDVVDFVVAYFDMLRTGDFSRAPALMASDKIALAERRMVPFAAERARFTEALVKKMEESDHFYCSVCRMTMITPRQALIHAIGGEHYGRARHELTSVHCLPVSKLVHAMIRIVGEAPDRWVNAEVAKSKDERKKHGTNITSPSLRPTPAFIRSLAARVGEEMFPNNGALPHKELVELAIPKFKEGFAARIVQELDDHIGDAQTYCDLCKTRTGTREEYYAHLQRYDHTKMTALIHAQTIAVNIVKARGGQ